MQPDVGILDILAMLGLFAVGFTMWLAWELITGSKLLAVFLAIGGFAATWWVAGAVGAGGPGPLLLIEAAVAFILIRVANGRHDDPTV